MITDIQNQWSQEEQSAARILQKAFLRKRGFDGIEFDKKLRELRDADAADINAGKYDDLVKQCVRYCRLYEDRFLLHKLVYTLFSGEHCLAIWRKSYHSRILGCLLYDSNSDFDLLAQVFEDTFATCKAESFGEALEKGAFCNSDPAIGKEVDSLYRLLKRIYDELKNKPDALTRDDLCELFGYDAASRTGEKIKRKTLHDPIKPEKELDKIDAILRLYMTENNETYQSFLAFKQRVETMVKKTSSVANIANNEIKELLESIDDYVNEDEEVFGLVPQSTPYWGKNRTPPLPENHRVKVSHGGGLFFISDFFLKRNKGYVVNPGEHGVGIYWSPPLKKRPERTGNYARSRAIPYFDMPVSVTGEIDTRYLQESKRANDEAILRYTNRDQLTVSEINILGGKWNGDPILPEYIKAAYPEDKDMQLRIAETILRQQTREGGKATWRNFIEEVESSAGDGEIPCMAP